MSDITQKEGKQLLPFYSLKLPNNFFRSNGQELLWHNMNRSICTIAITLATIPESKIPQRFLTIFLKFLEHLSYQCSDSWFRSFDLNAKICALKGKLKLMLFSQKLCFHFSSKVLNILYGFKSICQKRLFSYENTETITK